MNRKFQEIITTPAMTVPAMTTEEIRNILLEATVGYVKKTINLDTLVQIASKIHYFMGMRGEDSTQLENVLSQITNLTNRKNVDTNINSMLLESVKYSF